MKERSVTRGVAESFVDRGWCALLAAALLLAAPVRAIDAAGAASKPAGGGDDECISCHGDPGIEPVTKGRDKAKLQVTTEALKGSVHEDVTCTGCHQPGDSKGPAHYEDKGSPLILKCGDCHDKALKDYESTDIHGQYFVKHGKDAPWCHDCHGGHHIVPLKSPESPMSHKNQPELCGRCHSKATVGDEGMISKRRLVERYYTSVHWQNVQMGKPAAGCTDCHGHHTILPSSEKDSKVTRMNLLQTCSKCHPAEVETYSKGSHGRTLLHGNLDVPICTTCHGDHDMVSLKIADNGKRDFAATQICIWCHGNERLMARYALDVSPVESYMNDFHGLTQRGSLGTSATCADCHDAHYSLPSNHPSSRMNISNRGSVCGKCHGKMSESFITGFTHKPKGAGTRGIVKSVITWVYVLLIVGTIGAMLLHNVLVWSFFVRRKLRYQERHGTVTRLSTGERRWHWALFLSFSLLVLTGFALSFSGTSAVKWIYQIGLTEQIRGWLHRLGAIVMVVDMLVLVAFAANKRGRDKWLWAMMPGWRDLREFFGTVQYYLLRSPERPRYGVFNYGEKAEYWALWWGTAVMALTGIVMWFSTLLPVTTPGWVLEAARLIHFYEAVLATLAILVWHMYNTVFHPGEYPMDTTWLTGRLTDDEAKERFDDAAVAAQIEQVEVDQVEAPAKPHWMHDGHGGPPATGTPPPGPGTPPRN